MEKLVSIIIPCYNHGIYLDECLESVFSYPEQRIIEIILLNDGSTDPFTLTKVAEIEKKYKDVKVITNPNQGLAKTRNFGIALATGKYILPLDADNKIRKEYIEKALVLLESGKCDIVYAKPHFFGEINPGRIFLTKALDEDDIIFSNYIDACAVYRKEVWVKNGGYDAFMPFPGHEDWDFWISSIENGFRFSFLDEELYFYRIMKESMINKTVVNDGQSYNHKYIAKKHSDLFFKKLSDFNTFKRISEFEGKHPLRTVVKYFIRFLKAGIS